VAAAVAAVADLKAKREAKWRKEAKNQAEKRRGVVLFGDSVTQKDNTLSWVSGQPQAGQTHQILYNKRAVRGMNQYNDVIMHVGFDGWTNNLKEVSMYPLPRDDALRRESWELEHGPGDWWTCKVDVPSTAVMCDFVFSGGGNLFDNNQGQDYHTSVSGGLSLDELEEGIYQKVKASHEKKSAEDDERCYRSNLARALRRMAGISKTLDDNDDDMRMKRVATFLTVDPPNPKPGHPLVVRYDPSHTPLKGHSPVFLYGGWNRNTHKEKVREEMVREGDGWYSATLNVPQDACMLDFQVINRQGRDSNGNHGVKDDNHKRGYHVPIFNKNKR